MKKVLPGATALTVLGLGCGEFMTPDAPALLILPEDWTTQDARAVQDAALSWNFEFGTQLEVAFAQPTDFEDRQVRYVVDHADLCGEHSGGPA